LLRHRLLQQLILLLRYRRLVSGCRRLNLRRILLSRRRSSWRVLSKAYWCSGRWSRRGGGAIPAAPDVLAALIKNPATDAAIADQNRDFGFLVGERRTWLDLIKEK